METLAIKTRVRRPRPRELAVSSTKSMTGHLLGAAGGLEAGITRPAPAATRSCRRPSTTTFPDPECDLDYVPERGPQGRDRLRASATRSASAARTPRSSSSGSTGLSERTVR
ncbi:MAG: hypothetical protein MZU95_12900 [Desulfomicrobium escambiense]|nr:hypothetical protein [Desulfomicrobium escambiense]